MYCLRICAYSLTPAVMGRAVICSCCCYCLNSASTLSQSTAPPTVSYLGAKPPPSTAVCGGVGMVEKKDQSRPQAEGEDKSAGAPSPSPSLSKVSAQLEAALDESSQKLQVLVNCITMPLLSFILLAGLSWLFRS